ncbi:hypothetical protein Tco_0789797 [Tanacetum coccineum]
MAAPVITISSNVTEESVGSSEPADELPERHVSLRLYDDVVSRWRDMVRFRPSPSGSSSPDTTIPSAEISIAPTPPTSSTEITNASPACDTSTPVITASPAIRNRIRTTTRKSTLGLRPMMTPTHSAALRRARQAALSLETSSSDTSSGSSSYSTSHTSKSSFTASLQGTQISPEDYLHHSSEAIRSPSGPLTRRESETAAAATIVDGLDIEPVMAGVEMGFEPGLAVVESESEPEEAKASDETDAEIQPEGTIEIGVDVAIGIDIPDDLLMPDAIERLGQLEDGMREDELKQVRELRVHESQRLWRMETFMMRTQDYRP